MSFTQASLVMTSFRAGLKTECENLTAILFLHTAALTAALLAALLTTLAAALTAAAIPATAVQLYSCSF